MERKRRPLKYPIIENLPETDCQSQSSGLLRACFALHLYVPPAKVQVLDLHLNYKPPRPLLFNLCSDVQKHYCRSMNKNIYIIVTIHQNLSCPYTIHPKQQQQQQQQQQQ